MSAESLQCLGLGTRAQDFSCFEAELAQEVVCSHPVKAMAKINRVKTLERASHARCTDLNWDLAGSGLENSLCAGQRLKSCAPRWGSETSAAWHCLDSVQMGTSFSIRVAFSNRDHFHMVLFTGDSDVWDGFALLPLVLIFFLCFDGQKGKANSHLI